MYRIKVKWVGLAIVAVTGLVALLWGLAQASNPSHPVNPPLAVVATPTPTPTPIPVYDPLCGRAVADASLLERRPLAVKIDNSSEGRPQSGLSQACIVYEHLTEWVITRFTAIYYAEDVDPVGPIRSARLVDLDLATMYQALFAHIGASQPIMARIRASSILDLDQFWYPQAYYRSPNRPAPHNLYSSTQRLRQLAESKGWDKPVVLEPSVFTTSLASPPGIPTTYIAIPYGDSSLVEYRYDPTQGSYARFLAGQPHTDANTGQQILVTNVVIQYVRSRLTDFGTNDPAVASLDIELMGEGRAEILRDGQAFSGRWVRSQPQERTRFLDEAGRPIPFHPGNIWISLVPTNLEILKGS